MGRPKEHDETTARALLDAAEEIIDTRGIDALTVRGVADEIGTTTRAVYSLFGSRDGLLVALGTRTFELIGDSLRALPETDDPAADLIEAGVSVFRPFVVEHPGLFRIGFRWVAPKELDKQFGASRFEAGLGLVAKVERLDRAGLLGGRSVVEAVQAFDAFCEGLAELELRGRHFDPPSSPGRLQPRVRQLPPGEEEVRWRDALSALLSGWQSLPAPRPARGPRHAARPGKPTAKTASTRSRRKATPRRPRR
jgi:AcrR family transcriptional regulator